VFSNDPLHTMIRVWWGRTKC